MNIKWIIYSILVLAMVSGSGATVLWEDEFPSLSNINVYGTPSYSFDGDALVTKDMYLWTEDLVDPATDNLYVSFDYKFTYTADPNEDNGFGLNLGAVASPWIWDGLYMWNSSSYCGDTYGIQTSSTQPCLDFFTENNGEYNHFEIKYDRIADLMTVSMNGVERYDTPLPANFIFVNGFSMVIEFWPNPDTQDMYLKNIIISTDSQAPPYSCPFDMIVDLFRNYKDFYTFGKCYNTISTDLKYNILGDYPINNIINYKDFYKLGQVYNTPCP